MRKELIEIEEIENYLLNRLGHEAREQFEVKLLTDPALSENTDAQATAYRYIRRFWKQQTRRTLDQINKQLMQDISFRQRLL